MRIVEKIDVMKLRRRKTFLIVTYSKLENMDKPLYISGWEIGSGPKVSEFKTVAARFETKEDARRFFAENIRAESAATANKIKELANIFIVKG